MTVRRLAPVLLILLAPLASRADEADLDDLIRRFRQEKDEPVAVRIKVLDEIADVGTERAVRFLEEVIDEDEAFGVRSSAVHRLARIQRPSAFAVLRRLWKRAEDNLKSNVLTAMLDHRKEPDVREIVADVLESDNQAMRSTLIRWLGRRGDERFLPEAERFLEDFPTGETRLTVALVAVKTPGAAQLLVRIYDDSRNYDRGQVPPVFARGAADVQQVLVDALRSGDERLVANAIALATRAKVGIAEPALVALLPEAQGVRRAVLFTALGAVGAKTDEGRTAILEAIEDEDAAVAVAAVRAVRAVPGKAAIPILIRVMEDAADLLRLEIRVSLERTTGQQYGDRADLWAKWWREYGETFDPESVDRGAPDGVEVDAVNLAIDRGALALKSIRGEREPWTYGSQPVGTTALVCLALHAACVDPKDPDLREGVDYLRRATLPEHTYSVSLVAMALEAIGGKRYRSRLRECAKQLIETQLDSGCWNYPGLNRGDNSNAQYALLGLRAAARAGVRIPERTWRRARDHFLTTTCSDGGWSYLPTHRTTSSSSMTAGGVSSLLICLENMRLDEAEREELVAAIEAGFEALGKKMKIEKDSLYALYGIERAGILGERGAMAGNAWYAPGARRLLAEQTRDGFWRGAYSDAVSTSFAILFLKKATQPLAPSTRR